VAGSQAAQSHRYRRRQVRPIDFEGAVRIDTPSGVPWGTPGYAPPELDRGPVTGSNLPEDLHALGITIHQLYSSFVPVRELDDKSPMPKVPPLGVARKGVHQRTRALVAALTDPEPRNRPSAAEAAADLSDRERPGELRWRLVRRRRPPRAAPALVAPPGVARVVLENKRRAA